MSFENDHDQYTNKRVVDSKHKDETYKVGNMYFSKSSLFKSLTSTAGFVYRMNVAIVYNSIHIYVQIVINILRLANYTIGDAATIEKWVSLCFTQYSFSGNMIEKQDNSKIRIR